MNKEKYVKVLQEKLRLHMTVHQCDIFMHDGAPCHRSRVVKKFWGEKNIRQLDWPGNSPDLNPIENLWMLLKNKVSVKQPTNAKSLVTAIKEIWTKKISAEYCKKLTESMPQRIEAVLRSRGGHTKYWYSWKIALFVCSDVFLTYIMLIWVVNSYTFGTILVKLQKYIIYVSDLKLLHSTVTWWIKVQLH